MASRGLMGSCDTPSYVFAFKESALLLVPFAKMAVALPFVYHYAAGRVPIWCVVLSLALSVCVSFNFISHVLLLCLAVLESHGQEHRERRAHQFAKRRIAVVLVRCGEGSLLHRMRLTCVLQSVASLVRSNVPWRSARGLADVCRPWRAVPCDVFVACALISVVSCQICSSDVAFERWLLKRSCRFDHLLWCRCERMIVCDH